MEEEIFKRNRRVMKSHGDRRKQGNKREEEDGGSGKREKEALGKWMRDKGRSEGSGKRRKRK